MDALVPPLRSAAFHGSKPRACGTVDDGSPSDTRTQPEREKPDLTQGVAGAGRPDGTLLIGRVAGADVSRARARGEWFAGGANCTHYRGQLGDGLLVGDTVRCPLHHACFSLRTGYALCTPALDP